MRDYMSINKIDNLETEERQILAAVRGLRYGSVEISIHEGRVVQIETREKVRFEAGRRRPGDRTRNTNERAGAHPTTGGARRDDPEETE